MCKNLQHAIYGSINIIITIKTSIKLIKNSLQVNIRLREVNGNSLTVGGKFDTWIGNEGRRLAGGWGVFSFDES